MRILPRILKSNIKDTKLYTKICIKAHVAIHIEISGNTHTKLYQSKLNDINYYVYCYMGFSINFSTQFGVPSIIRILNKLEQRYLFGITFTYTPKK